MSAVVTVMFLYCTMHVALIVLALCVVLALCATPNAGDRG